MPHLPIQFEQPTWLWGLLLVVPAIWLGRKSMSGLGPWRQRFAIAMRVVVLVLLVMLLAMPLYVRKFNHLSVMTIIDRSQSIPEDHAGAVIGYLQQVVGEMPKEDRLGIVEVGETALIQSLPNISPMPSDQGPAFVGDRTDLEAGVRIALAVFPDDTAKRVLLISDGNENAGNLREVAEIAKANDVAIDVLPITYNHDKEVMLERLITPHNARVGQTVAIRVVLRSSHATSGKLLLEANERAIDLDSNSEEMALPVTLELGLNVTTVFVPVSGGGVHRYRANFIPDREESDTLSSNNTGAAVTFVASRGNVLVVDADQVSATDILKVLADAKIATEYRLADDFPTDLLTLMSYDAVVLVNTPNSSFAYAQQEMIARYVQDMGGGLVMVGGPDSFGAGGWIGSPVEESLPVSLDPPQRQQMPKGALAMIMHSTEMPKGNFWGIQVAVAAAKSLSRLDLVGVIAYDWQQGGCAWVYPLSPAGNKAGVIAAIKKMQMGDMPDFQSGLNLAYNDLRMSNAGQKHVIIISDGDPAAPPLAQLNKMKAAKITVSTVAIGSHSMPNTMRGIAHVTGGRFYNVSNPSKLPQIFVKEAQTVRRALISEETFVPRIVAPLSELTKGLELNPPPLDGYVLAVEKRELVETVMVGPQGDPILTSRQYGLGKTVAFTSGASSRWAGQWLNWPRFAQFWEQILRWSMRSDEAPNMQVITEVEGSTATVHVEATGEGDDFANFLDISGSVVNPDLSSERINMEQVGPGRYRAQFPAQQHGTYIVNLQYRDGEKMGLLRGAVSVPFAPEFRDLKSNPATLAEAAQITGGRVLSNKLDNDELFSHAGLIFPDARKPLWKQLALLWLVLFLMDVAVRRVAIDPAALMKRLRESIASRRSQPTPEAVATLRAHQEAVKKKLKRDSAERRVAARRYEAPPGAEQTQLLDQAQPGPPKPQKPEKTPIEEIPPESPTSYIDRLKQAKQQAEERMKNDE